MRDIIERYRHVALPVAVLGLALVGVASFLFTNRPPQAVQGRVILRASTPTVLAIASVIGAAYWALKQD